MRTWAGALGREESGGSMRELSDRVAVVTGAARGIGRALALELAREGMHLMLADVDPAALGSVAREVEALGRRACVSRVDVRELSGLEGLLRDTLRELGRCDLVCNNAGVFHGAALLDTPSDQWERVLETNVWGVIHGCRVFGAHFVQQGHGHIVNTASAAGLFPVPGMSAYSTSKYAVVGLSMQLRWELASAGVGVTLLCPGVVRTGIAYAEGVGLSHLDRELEKALARSPGPEGLAKKAVRAIRKDRPLVRYGADSYVFSLLRVLPLWLVDPFGRYLGWKALRIVRGEEKP
ncbi:MAG: SDR family NAD(P)-dependent oxidoreductase [Myxococcales bacterium]